MGKNPSFNLSLKQIDKYLLKSSPVFDSVVMRARVHLDELNEEEKKDLEYLANIEGGTIERWLIVPDTISLGVLRFVIERAFGIVPGVFTSLFFLDDGEEKRLFPTLEGYLKRVGSIFSQEDTEYDEELMEASYSSKDFIPPILYCSMMKHDLSYDEYQIKLEEEISSLRKKGIKSEGKIVPFSSLPNDLNLLNNKTNDRSFTFTYALDKAIEVRDCLAKEGKTLPPMEKRDYPIRSSIDKGRRYRPMPFTYTLFLHEIFLDKLAFKIELTEPVSVFPLLEEGFLSIEDYIESLSYVTRNLKADCIYKKGYDLFGAGQKGYYEFILALHDENRIQTLEYGKLMGWREPFIDAKKVLR